MTKDQENNIFEGQGFDWDAYTLGRPDYKLNNFYSRIWAYHGDKNGGWACAHDVGAGHGVVSDVLVPRFEQVIVSDVSAFHLNKAKQRLQSSPNASFTICPAEKIAEQYPGGSVDFIAAAECAPLIDAPKALAGFAQLLRPGGTLAIWFYGGPIYVDEGSEKIYKLHRSITARSCDEYRGFPSWEKAQNTLYSWLDDIRFPDEHWTNIKRTKWNSDKSINFEDEEDAGYAIQRTSAIRPDEEVEKITDRTWWAKKVNFQWAKNSIEAQIPRSKDYKTPDVLRMFEELEQEMGGPNKSHNVAYPAVLMLATRK